MSLATIMSSITTSARVVAAIQSCLTVAAHVTTGDRVVIRAMDDVQAANCRRLVVEAFRRRGLSVCPSQPRHASELVSGPAVDVVAETVVTLVAPVMKIVRPT